MPLPWPEELSRQDRVIYRRWVDGLFAIYCVLSIVAAAYVAHQTMRAPTSTQAHGKAADAKSAAPPPITQAVKDD